MEKKPLISGAEAKRLAAKYGTPLYVYRQSVVAETYRRLRAAIPYPKTRIYYACKANANAKLLATLRRAGACIETVSPGEVALALRAGFPPSRISFTCSNLSEKELLAVAKKGVRMHLDSLNQVRRIGAAFPGSSIFVRINTGLGAGHHSHVITGGPESKFGIYHTDIPELLRIVREYGLTVAGLEQHIGSNILDARAFVRAMRNLLESAKRFPDLEAIDFGGGLGIPYRPEEKPLDVRALGARVSAAFAKFCKAYGRELELAIEPGRYLVAEAGALLAEVTDRKETTAHSFVGVDTGFNHLVRPMMYGSYHHIFNLTNPRGKKESVTVAGNICESGDIFAKHRALPAPRIGDLLLFADAGAYGYVMGSDYNQRPRPREIVLD
ncbi:MAG: diaminopimelate decarboxylase [Patescibacteria group bacterium]|nr:diaminopimelate decarboxylase [Patescibacteria group bacterium]MDE1965682.1 diaminopimelate decarboxylase [Patescibacteria group bacterium]